MADHPTPPQSDVRVVTTTDADLLRKAALAAAAAAVAIALITLLGGCAPANANPEGTTVASGSSAVQAVPRDVPYVDPAAPVPAVGDRVEWTDAEWRTRLTPEQFRILREHGTEYAFRGVFNNHPVEGVYHCAGCNAPLYSSADKFDSGTGWPSYTRPVAEGRVAERRDASLGMVRTEVVCAACDGHLGHVFPDGPPPTGERHCINSVAMRFLPTDLDGDGQIAGYAP